MLRIKEFVECDAGAVTVDWVVLTAGLVGLGLATMTVVSSGVSDLSTDIDDTLQERDGKPIIWTSFNLPGPFTIDNETLTGVQAYGEVGYTIDANNTLGSISGDNAYVITSSDLDTNGVMAGGFILNTVGDDALIEGQSYKISYWARAETGSVNISSIPYGPNETGANTPDYDGRRVEAIGEEWTKVEYEYTATKDAGRFLLATNDLDVTYAVDDLKIEMVR